MRKSKLLLLITALLAVFFMASCKTTQSNDYTYPDLSLLKNYTNSVANILDSAKENSVQFYAVDGLVLLVQSLDSAEVVDGVVYLPEIYKVTIDSLEQGVAYKRVGGTLFVVFSQPVVGADSIEIAVAYKPDSYYKLATYQDGKETVVDGFFNGRPVKIIVDKIYSSTSLLFEMDKGKPKEINANGVSYRNRKKTNAIIKESNDSDVSNRFNSLNKTNSNDSDNKSNTTNTNTNGGIGNLKFD